MIKLDFDAGCAVLLLDRPPANAINAEWLTAFHAALDALHARPDIAVLHLRSARRMFSAGADLRLMAESLNSPAGADAMLSVAEGMQRAFDRLAAVPQVTVAEVGGAALGGGLEMALACDLRFVADEAVVGLPEARLGLLPGAGGTQRLASLCGAALAKRLIFGTETVQGADAVRLGIAQWHAPASELPTLVRQHVLALASLPAAALAACKRCIDLATPPQQAGYLAELFETRRLYGSESTRALVHAFITKGQSSS